jgi:hypothetical protein
MVLSHDFHNGHMDVHNGHVDFGTVDEAENVFFSLDSLVFFFFALWCWAAMRLQHQLTPPAVRRLRHLLLLGEFPTCTFLSFFLSCCSSSSSALACFLAVC